MSRSCCLNSPTAKLHATLTEIAEKHDCSCKPNLTVVVVLQDLRHGPDGRRVRVLARPQHMSYSNYSLYSFDL